jgi:hypothetical protein
MHPLTRSDKRMLYIKMRKTRLYPNYAKGKKKRKRKNGKENLYMIDGRKRRKQFALYKISNNFVFSPCNEALWGPTPI